MIIGIAATGVLVVPLYIIKLPPAVRRTQCISIFCGWMRHTIRLYVTRLLGRTADLAIENIVYLPFTSLYP